MCGFSYQVENLTPHPAIVIWKMTMRCNFTCLHCGFSAGEPLSNELTTDEALSLCDELIKMKAGHVALSGGEPLMRKDWPKISEKLSKSGILVTMVTNGYLLNEKNIAIAKQNGIKDFTISIDGMEASHDNIRKKGSFNRAISAIKLAKDNGYSVGVITTINKLNYSDLDNLFYYLRDSGIRSWQVQLSDGIGYMNKNRHEMLPPEALPGIERKIIKYHNIQQETNHHMNIQIGDNIGYYSDADIVLRSDYTGGCYTGCFAGIYVIGIDSNGNIKGCPTLPDSMIEGNIRETNLSKLFYRDGAFSYNRSFDKNCMEGSCRKCSYLSNCRGGCIASRLGSKGTLSENVYCTHKQKLIADNMLYLGLDK